MNKKKIFFVIICIILVSGIFVGPIMSNVEQAKYIVTEKHGNKEIRHYDSMLIAEVSVSGDRKASINNGFRAIADYIFGNNSSRNSELEKNEAKSEKIAMTAPVVQRKDADLWKVYFIMPSNYTIKTLPIPNNQSIEIKSIPSSYYAVIRFSGIADTQSLDQHTAQLEEFIRNHNLKALSKPAYAFFNPPWTLPFLRRNEVMIKIDKIKKSDDQ